MSFTDVSMSTNLSSYNILVSLFQKFWGYSCCHCCVQFQCDCKRHCRSFSLFCCCEKSGKRMWTLHMILRTGLYWTGDSDGDQRLVSDHMGRIKTTTSTMSSLVVRRRKCAPVKRSQWIHTSDSLPSPRQCIAQLTSFSRT